MDKLKEILPPKIQDAYEKYKNGNLTQIRMRKGKPIYFYIDGIEYGVSESGLSRCDGYVFTSEDAAITWKKLCGGAPYSVTENQRAGYITVDGNRVGFAGEYAAADGEVKHLLNVTSFCIRIMHTVCGCANGIYPKIFSGNFPGNTLIVSPPGCGKTTVLRELARKFSSDGYSVCIADERSEIAGRGIDVGKRTDIFCGADKSKMINNMIRSLQPDIIIADEIGSEEDGIAIKNAMTSGVAVIASAHGRSAEDVKKRLKINFEKYIVLDETFIYSKNFKVTDGG